MPILSVVMVVSRVAELEGSDADEPRDVEHRQATNTSACTVAQPEHTRCRQVHTKYLDGGL